MSSAIRYKQFSIENKTRDLFKLEDSLGNKCYALSKGMLWPHHVLSTQFMVGAVSWSDVFWSVAPDLPMVFLVPWPVPWSLIQDWWIYSVLYKVPHSLFFLILIQNSKARKIYALHILMDVLTHKGQWSIEPLWPFGGPVSGIGDAAVWT